MNKKAEYLDRYFYWRGKGYDHIGAKQMAVDEMIGFGLIKSKEELYQNDEHISCSEKHRQKKRLRNILNFLG